MANGWGPVLPADRFAAWQTPYRNVIGEERNRVPNYQRRWAYYQDAPPKMLAVKPGDVDDNVALGYPRLIVDVGVSFLFGDKITFTSEDDQHLEVINAAWGDEMRRMTTLNEAGTNGGVCGEVFLKLSLTDELSPYGGPLAHITVLDPSNVEVYWRPDDYTEITGYKVEWMGYDPRLDKMIAYRQDINPIGPEVEAGWVIEDFRTVGESDEVQTGLDIWPYPFPPIVECQNLPAANEFYGEADLNDGVLHVVDRLNFSASNIAKILRYHAHPKVFAYGFPAKDLDFSPDKVTQIQNEQARVDILQMPSDLAAAYSFHDRLQEALFQMARIPQIALGNLQQVGVLSSLAMKLAFQPITEKTDTKRELYGALITETNRRILAIAGVADASVGSTDIVWPPVTPQDPMADAQEALALSNLGVSKQTLIERLGFDPQVEMTQNAEEGQAALDQMQQRMAQGQPPL